MPDEVKRYFKPPKGSFFLFGPRGTGKSTWVKEHFSDCLYIDLLLADEERLYAARPEELIKRVHAEKKKTVIIDEVQKVPELLSSVHALIEEKKGVQFILTGSSARKLKREGVDLLGGRAINRSMHPFMASELGDNFELDVALKFGMLPLVIDSEDRGEVLRSYIDLYVIQEVQYEGLVRNIGSFARFVSSIAFSHGNILNVSNVARDCEVKRSTVENYIQVLHDLLLAMQLPVFTRRAKRTLAQHPKFYLFDSGVFRASRNIGPMDSVSEIDGAALEGLVLQHLRAWCDYTKGNDGIFFWRTKSGLEVDFVVYGENGFWAIEVKNNKKVSPKDVRGLLSFVEDYPECTPFLLYRGKEKIMEKGVLCLPCEDFLMQLVPGAKLLKH